ncbi:hypothetical protein ACQY0O_004865 [Thecaphora frezii]
MPATRMRRLAASVRDSSSSYRNMAALSENATPRKRAAAESSDLGGGKAATALLASPAPTRKPLGERNIVPQVLVPSPAPPAKPPTNARTAAAAARRPTRAAATATRTRTKATTAPHAPLAEGSEAASASATAAAPASNRQLGAEGDGGTHAAEADPARPAIRARPQAAAATARSPTSRSFVSVDVPNTREYKRTAAAASSRQPSDAGPSEARSHNAAAVPSLPPQSQSQSQSQSPSPSPSQSPSQQPQQQQRVLVPDSDDLEYVDPDATTAPPAPQHPHHQPQAAARGQDPQAPKVPGSPPSLSQHSSSDKENRPPLSRRSFDDANRGPTAAASASVPLHSTPMTAARLMQRRGSRPGDPSGSSTATTRLPPAVLDDLFPMSSASGSPRPASRSLLEQQQRQLASDQESQLERYRLQGYAKAERWAQEQRLTSRTTSQEQEDEAEIVRLVESSPPHGQAAVTSFADDADSLRSFGAGEPDNKHEEEEDEDPFGFFECQAKLKARRAAETQAQKLERRNQPLQSELLGTTEEEEEKGEEQKAERGQGEGVSGSESRRAMDDVELARTAFRSSSPQSDAQQRGSGGNPVKRRDMAAAEPIAPEASTTDDRAEDGRAPSGVTALLEKSTLPPPPQGGEDPLDAAIRQTTRLPVSHRGKVSAGEAAVRASSPLSALSSAPPSPRHKPRTRSATATAAGGRGRARTRSHRSGSKSVVVIPGIPLKRTEVKERQVLELMARKSSPSGSSSTSPSLPTGSGMRGSNDDDAAAAAAAKRRKAAANPLTMKELVALLPGRRLNGRRTRRADDDEEEEGEEAKNANSDEDDSPPKGRHSSRSQRAGGAKRGAKGRETARGRSGTKRGARTAPQRSNQARQDASSRSEATEKRKHAPTAMATAKATATAARRGKRRSEDRDDDDKETDSALSDLSDTDEDQDETPRRKKPQPASLKQRNGTPTSWRDMVGSSDPKSSDVSFCFSPAL